MLTVEQGQIGRISGNNVSLQTVDMLTIGILTNYLFAVNTFLGRIRIFLAGPDSKKGNYGMYGCWNLTTYVTLVYRQ